MATVKTMLPDLAWDERYAVSGIEDVLTPALVMYPDAIASNIERTIKLLDGEPDRWRVHIKTSKARRTLEMLVERGVRNFKCATTLELLTACQCGAADVLVAYPVMGANAERVRQIAEEFPKVHVSVLAESESQVRQYSGSRLGVFLDINPGMNRTGIEQSRSDQVLELARTCADAQVEFRGLHYYDGQYGSVAQSDRMQATHLGYDRLLEIVHGLNRSGIRVHEVITAGTPTFPCSLTYQGFRGSEFLHRVSPGTVVYCDATSLEQLPKAWGYRPGALVLSRVVSAPHAGIVTCDAGHKTVSADSGIPTCLVVGHPELTPLSPSEEHLPIAVSEGATSPRLGETIYLLPRHICPTVNNFDCALFVRNGEIESVEKITARGREAPIVAGDRALSVRG
jgi:D-serine deaminase-like pyridoxal phosphate-dependent protein